MKQSGIVAGINQTLCSFTLCTYQDKIVYAGLYLLNNPEESLPKVGEEVTIKFYHRNLRRTTSAIFLCKHSKVICNKKTPLSLQDCRLIKYLQDYSMGIPDLQTVHDMYVALTENFKEKKYGADEDLIFEIIDKFSHKREQFSNRCDSNNIPNITLKPVSEFKNIDIENKTKDFCYWNFGVQCYGESFTFLIGHFHIERRYGLPCLTDSNWLQCCLISAKNCEDLDQISNKMILVNKFHVFSEIFQDIRAIDLEYFHFSLDDVIVLNAAAGNKETFFREKPKDKQLLFDFKLLNKSAPMLSAKNEKEIWLDVLKNNSERIYLGFDKRYLPLHSLLQAGNSYGLYSGSLISGHNFEIARINKQQKIFKVTGEAQIVKLNEKGEEDEVKTLEELRSGTDNLQGLISFEAVVKTKKFNYSNSSRTARQNKVYGFGTQGGQTHTLLFMTKLEKNMSLYLNNWEPMLIPYGLVPFMRLRVNNVVAQKTYLKSTALTTFQVLSYDPPVEFHTANLSKELWGKSSSFSYGHAIPPNAIVWGRVYNVLIRSFRMSYNCSDCDLILERPGDCSCGCVERKLNIMTTLIITDEVGQSVVINKNLDLVMILLDMNKKEFEMWLRAFEHVGFYIYKVFDDDTYLNCFSSQLSQTIKIHNALAFYEHLLLKCRRLESSTSDNNGKPLWFCLDALHLV